MKNIQNYRADKYLSDSYLEIAPGVFRYGTDYVTSLSFEQEPELGEGSSPAEISQFPLEDILDKFLVHVSDFYIKHNSHSSNLCFLEFCSPQLENIKCLRSIIGAHVYNITRGSAEDEFIDLVIENP